jgi:repressor LexA
VRRWEAVIVSPSEGHLAALAKLFDVAEDAILRESGVLAGAVLHPVGPQEDFRIKGYVSAGIPRDAWEVDLGTIALPADIKEHHPESFVLIVSGESLKDDGIQDGDMLVVDPHSGLQIGKLYVVRIGPEFCARHIYIENDHVRLKAANSHYEDIKVTDCNIVGRVIWKMGRM